MILKEEIKILENTKYPCIFIETSDPNYSFREIEELAYMDSNLLYLWNEQEGLIQKNTNEKYIGTQDPYLMLQMSTFLMSKNKKQNSIFVLQDFNQSLKKDLVKGRFVEVLTSSKLTDNIFVIISNEYNIDEDIRADIAHIIPKMPSVKEIKKIMVDTIKEVMRVNNKLKINLLPPDQKKILKALSGLSKEHIQDFVNQSLSNGVLNKDDIDTIMHLKKDEFDKDSFLRFSTTQNMQDLIGFRDFKEWLRGVSQELLKPQSDKAQFLACLLAGVRGCGKSSAIKSIANELDIPLYNLNISKLFTDFSVMSLEEKLEKVLLTIKRLTPMALWIDEVESIFISSKQTNHYKECKNAFNKFFKELKNINDTFVFLVDVKDLEEFSDEFFGEKYFNNEFFIDLPSKEQIKNLLEHFLQKRELEIESVDFEILTKCIQGFSAGQIEEVLLTAIYQDDAHNILTLSERLIKEFKAKELKAITNLKHAAVFQEFAKQRCMQWI